MSNLCINGYFQSYKDIVRVTMKVGLCPIIGLMIDKYANYVRKFDELRRDAIQIFPIMSFFTMIVVLLAVLVWVNVNLASMWLELCRLSNCTQ